MKQRKQILLGTAAAVGMLIMILDPKTSLAGAKDGIELCLNTVIPSLFPFIFLSTLITGSLGGNLVSCLHPIGTLCNMPPGSEFLLFLGLLGGYPTGAQSVYRAYCSRQIRKEDARRLLVFCNNAGPAFIFGIAGSLFSSPKAAWTLWLIQILSALSVGALTRADSKTDIVHSSPSGITVTGALTHGIRATAAICGWVTLFRILITFCGHWFLWMLSPEANSLVNGILELANGCFSLINIKSEGLRYILCSSFLSLGGLCVTLQTVSVANGLVTGLYFKGKILQTMISFTLASVSQTAAVPQNCIYQMPSTVFIAAVLSIFILSGGISLKKSVAFARQLVYNNKKAQTR